MSQTVILADIDVPYLTQTEEPPAEPAGLDAELLVRAVVDGEAAALRELVARHHEALVGYCYRIVRDEDQVKDILQLLWVRVIELKNPATITNPRALFFTIARNLCLDHIKMTNRRSRAMAEAFYHIGNDARALDDDRAEAVREAVARLSPEDQELLLHRYYNGLSLGEIATLMKTTAAAIAMRHARAKNRLRKALAELER